LKAQFSVLQLTHLYFLVFCLISK